VWSLPYVGESDTGGLLDIGLRPIWVLLVELLDGVVRFDVTWDCPCVIFGSIAFPVDEVLNAVSSSPARVEDLIDFVFLVAAYYLGWQRWRSLLVLR